MTDDNETPLPEEPKKKATRVKLKSASGETVKAARQPKQEPTHAERARVSLNRSYAKLDDQTMNKMYGSPAKKNNAPLLLWGAVGLLLVAGIVLLVVWMMSGNGPKISLFATETPTPTVTPSPTSTPLPPTETPIPTQTFTPTPSQPFEYIVQENDNLTVIATLFDPENTAEFVEKILELNPQIPPSGIISLGQKILIPHPGYQLATATPIPTGIAYGTKIEYIVRSGDTINYIASLFNSTPEDILKENPDLTDANALFVGQLLVIRVNIVTPTPKPAPTITAGPSPTPPSPFTATPASGG